MDHAHRHAFERSTSRVEELVFALDALPDPAAAAAARELLQLVLELHGTALARMMETIASDPSSERLVDALATDETVSGVLLLHGLHPQSLDTRVRLALDWLRPHLGVQGVAVQDLVIDGDRVRLTLGTSDAGRYDASAAAAIRREVRQSVSDAAPEATVIEVIGPPAPAVLAPLSAIAARRPAGDGAGALR